MRALLDRVLLSVAAWAICLAGAPAAGATVVQLQGNVLVATGTPGPDFIVAAFEPANFSLATTDVFKFDDQDSGLSATAVVPGPGCAYSSPPAEVHCAVEGVTAIEVNGGDGDDVIGGGGKGVQSPVPVTLRAEAGNDRLGGGTIGSDVGRVRALGESGDDFFNVSGTMTADGAAGDDKFSYETGPGLLPTLAFGGSGNDEFQGRGGAGPDVIDAGDGNDDIDVFNASGPADTVNCGTGADVLVADARDQTTGCEPPAAPLATLSGPTSQRLGRTVSVTTTCTDKICRVKTTGAVRVPKVGRAKARTFKLRPAEAYVVKGGSAATKPRISLPARTAIKRALTAGKRVVATLRVTVADSKGVLKRTLTRAVRLKR